MHRIPVSCLCVLPAVLMFFQSSGKPSPYLKQAVIAQTEKGLHITANSPRPLAQVLDALQRKYGWQINYEDPQDVYSGDLAPLPPAHAQPSDPASQVRLPNGGAFTLDLPVALAPALPDEAKALSAVVDAYNQSGNPGRFELRKESEQNFDVVGTSARDEKGRMSEQTVVLDVPITLAEQPRSAVDTIDLIFQQVSQASHIEVARGVSPRSLLAGSKVTVGGTKVAARVLLARTLAGTNRTLYWRMLFNPESKGYLLSLHLQPHA
ncbi:MAG TPA: hypothetical protein VN777_18660 [Terriglobales bacterium]|nr:hypothetical protein [Terriglobales bacterium]